jgi:hypothetical protein
MKYVVDTTTDTIRDILDELPVSIREVVSHWYYKINSCISDGCTIILDEFGALQFRVVKLVLEYDDFLQERNMYLCGYLSGMCSDESLLDEQELEELSMRNYAIKEDGSWYLLEMPVVWSIDMNSGELGEWKKYAWKERDKDGSWIDSDTSGFFNY